MISVGDRVKDLTNGLFGEIEKEQGAWNGPPWDMRFTRALKIRYDSGGTSWRTEGNFVLVEPGWVPGNMLP